MRVSYCPKCGYPLEEDFEYCPRCGFRLADYRAELRTRAFRWQAAAVLAISALAIALYWSPVPITVGDYIIGGYPWLAPEESRPVMFALGILLALIFLGLSGFMLKAARGSSRQSHAAREGGGRGFKLLAVALALLLAALAGLYVLGFFALTGLRIGGVEVLKPCEVEVRDVRVVSVGVRSAKLEVVFLVRNSNPVAARASSVTYDVYVEGEYAASGSAPALEVPPGGYASVSSQVEVEYARAAQAAQAIIEAKLRGGRVHVEVRGKALFETPAGPVGVPFTRFINVDP